VDGVKDAARALRAGEILDRRKQCERIFIHLDALILTRLLLCPSSPWGDESDHWMVQVNGDSEVEFDDDVHLFDRLLYGDVLCRDRGLVHGHGHDHGHRACLCLCPSLENGR